jgi:hypothetical protein
MLLLKLSAVQIGMFDEAESGMGVHFASVEDYTRSGRVLWVPNAEGREGQSQSDALSTSLWFDAQTRRRRPETLAPASEAEIAEQNNLIAALADAPLSTRPFVMGFILNPPGYLPPTPRRPTHIYGHLPFTGASYRCELGDEPKSAIRNERHPWRHLWISSLGA